jgi:hypothetical protein
VHFRVSFVLKCLHSAHGPCSGAVDAWGSFLTASSLYVELQGGKRKVMLRVVTSIGQGFVPANSVWRR